MAIARIPIQIRFADVDMAGHVHNSVPLHWFELARIALLSGVAGPANDWRKQGLILARNEIDYVRPILLQDRIAAECTSGRVGSKSFDLHYRILRTEPDGGEACCAEGRSVMVCYDYTLPGSIAVPAPWRESLTAR